MTMACYRRSMSFRPRIAAVLAAVAFATAACGASSPTAAEPGDEVSSTDEAPGNPAQTTVSLGDREAGFGPGSFAVIAGEVASRLADIEGNWQQIQPYTFVDRPEECGLPDPIAVQGGTLSFIDPTEFAFFDFIGAEVLIFETDAEAVEAVEALNGPNAQECDRIFGDQTDFEDVAGVGLDFDIGDGVGEPAQDPAATPNGRPVETRRYEATLGSGSVTRDVVQIESAVADGRFVVSFVAATASDQTNDGVVGDGGTEELLNTAAELLFSDPLPELVVDADLDEAIDDVRRSVLVSSDLADFWDEGPPAAISNDFTDPEGCYEVVGQARVSGPIWMAINPLSGGSQLFPNTAVYADEATAAASFAEFVNLGVDCFVDSLQLTPDFRVNGRAFDTVVVEGIDVVVIRLDVAQTVGTQVVDVEIGFASAQADRFTTGVFFGGLIGDSPDLGVLASTAAQRLEANVLGTD